jgi:hypothetical protein
MPRSLEPIGDSSIVGPREAILGERGTRSVTTQSLQRCTIGGCDRDRGVQAAYAVYGDWLAERGDPRGELVALQLALAAGYDQATAERAQRLLDEYAWEWLGKLAWLDGDELLLEWRHGFVKEVWFGNVEAANARSTDTHIEELARLPSMAFVERIEIGPKDVWFDDAFRTMGRVGLPATARALVIVNSEYEHLGCIEPAYPALSHVEELRLHSCSMDLGRIDLPSLRALELVTRGLTRANLASLHAARWPHLEKLVLWIGDEGADDCDITVDDLDWILAGDGLPAVTCLGLCGRVHVLPLLERLVVAPIVKRLAKLELAGGHLGVAEVTYLREHHGAFAHLQELRVPGTVVATDVSSIGPNVYSEPRFVPVYE